MLYIHVLLYDREAQANSQCLPCLQCVLQWLNLHSGRPDEEVSKIECNNLITKIHVQHNYMNSNLPGGGGTPSIFGGGGGGVKLSSL